MSELTPESDSTGGENKKKNWAQVSPLVHHLFGRIRI
jgi:hypothetical protein